MEATAVAAAMTVAEKAIKADRNQVAEGELQWDRGTGPATKGALAKPTVWRSDPATAATAEATKNKCFRDTRIPVLLPIPTPQDGMDYT